MASSIVGSLRVNLGLDSANFQRGARNMKAPLDRMRNQFQAVAGVAAIAFGAISAAALAGARDIDEAAKSARRLDASIGAFRGLELAAGEAGVSLSSLTNDLQSMNREIANIGVSGNAGRALAQLGLDAAAIENLDADEKLATIADRVKALGLSSGEATALLRDLGVRNREMALLVIQGGDAIRSASADIKDYGLEVSAIDSSRIEVANDQLGRLGLITKYAGDQLAIALVPAMGRLAEVMTDSLREGGLLRTMIDGLADNIDTVIASIGVAVTAFGVRYVAALAVARGATGLFSGSLIVLRGALLATGIGALVVAAGFLITRLKNLVQSTGSFGNALALLKRVAVDVWGKIKAGAELMHIGLQITFNNINESWLNVIGTMAQSWAQFVDSIAGSKLGELMGLEGGNSAAVESKYNTLLNANTEALVALRNNRDAAQAAMGGSIDGLAELNAAMAGTTAEIEAGVEPIGDVASGLDDVADAANGGGSGASGGAARSLAETTDVAETMAETFTNRLGQAVDDLAGALANFAATGFKNFKDMADSIKATFTSMVSDLIKTAVANPIKLALGIGGGGAGALAGGLGGSGGILGSLTGGLSALSGGVGSGLAVALNGMLTGGGLGPTLGAISGGIGVGGLAGIGTAIGAALPIIGIAGAVFSFFKSKTKLLDSGIRATIDMESAMFESFRKIEKSKFWGLSKKTSVKYKDLTDAESEPFREAVFGVQESVIGATDALGISVDVFEGFSTRFKVSLKGLDDAAKEAAVLDALEGLGDEMAAIVLGWGQTTETVEKTFLGFRLGMKEVAGSVDGAYDELMRLSTALVTVNDVFRDLGPYFTSFATSLEGAGLADAFAGRLGGIEGFTAATTAFYDLVYSDAEKLANVRSRMADDFAAIGIDAIPNTVADYRSAVEDAMAVGNTDLAADLIGLAGAFGVMTDAMQSVSSATLRVNEDLFSTGQDFRRAQGRAANGIAYTAGQYETDRMASNKMLADKMDRQQATLEIIARHMENTANSTEDMTHLAAIQANALLGAS